MIWYFNAGDVRNAAAWRALVAAGVQADPRGVTGDAGVGQPAADALLIAHATVEWVRGNQPDAVPRFVAQLLQARERGSKFNDLSIFGDLAAEAGLAKIMSDAAAEQAVLDNTTAWQALGAPELPCLVRPDGHVLLGVAAAATVAQFAA